MKRLNNWLAVKITSAVGTMTCAYLFALLAIAGFPYHDMTAQTVVQWVSQTFIQLTLLAVIMVGQKLQSDKTIHHVKRHLDANHAEHKDEIALLHERISFINRPRFEAKEPHK